MWGGLEYVEHKPPVCLRSCHEGLQDDNLLPSISVSYTSTGSVWDSEDDCDIDDLKDVTNPSVSQINNYKTYLAF